MHDLVTDMMTRKYTQIGIQLDDWTGFNTFPNFDTDKNNTMGENNNVPHAHLPENAFE